MYLSILGGAVWGMPIALPLVCCCVATGATLCYLISSALGPALLTLPKWKAMLDKWARKIQRNQVGFPFHSRRACILYRDPSIILGCILSLLDRIYRLVDLTLMDGL